MTLILHLQAPMMSFGGVAVDDVRPTEVFPTLSLLTGLVANALGYDHRQTDALAQLQARIRYAARTASPTLAAPDKTAPTAVPRRMVDYQTADLGQSFMDYRNVAWTTAGTIEERLGGTAKFATTIRRREYLANGFAVVALTLGEGEGPDESAVFAALRHPARPLFIGRQCCLPATPIAHGRTPLDIVSAAAGPLELEGRTLLTPAPNSRDKEPISDELLNQLWLPGDAEAPAGWDIVDRRSVYDQRDWANQMHTGQRTLLQCLRTPIEEAA